MHGAALNLERCHRVGVIVRCYDVELINTTSTAERNMVHYLHRIQVQVYASFALSPPRK